MRSFAYLAVAATLSLASVAASAMPLDPGLGKDQTLVTQVRDGCGPGGFRGPYGGCRPRFSCPPGWHPGPYGWHCFRNWRRYW